MGNGLQPSVDKGSLLILVEAKTHEKRILGQQRRRARSISQNRGFGKENPNCMDKLDGYPRRAGRL